MSICPTPKELINNWPYEEEWLRVMLPKEAIADALIQLAFKIVRGTANQEHSKYLVNAMLHLAGK